MKLKRGNFCLSLSEKEREAWKLCVKEVWLTLGSLFLTIFSRFFLILLDSELILITSLLNSLIILSIPLFISLVISNKNKKKSPKSEKRVSSIQGRVSGRRQAQDSKTETKQKQGASKAKKCCLAVNLVESLPLRVFCGSGLAGFPPMLTECLFSCLFVLYKPKIVSYIYSKSTRSIYLGIYE